jgi:hypothetical protein
LGLKGGPKILVSILSLRFLNNEEPPLLSQMMNFAKNYTSSVCWVSEDLEGDVLRILGPLLDSHLTTHGLPFSG